MTRTFRLLIALFPRHFRETYGADMQDVFRDQLTAARASRTWTAVPVLWARTALRMTGAAMREHRSGHPFLRGSAMMDFFHYDLRFTGRALARTRRPHEDQVRAPTSDRHRREA